MQYVPATAALPPGPRRGTDGSGRGGRPLDDQGPPSRVATAVTSSSRRASRATRTEMWIGVPSKPNFLSSRRSMKRR